MRKQNFRTDVHKNKFTDNMRNMGQIYIWKCGGKITWNDKIKTGTVLHIEMLLEKSWRPEQGIIYDCYVNYVTRRSLGLVSWDGGVLEYIMLLLYTV